MKVTKYEEFFTVPYNDPASQVSSVTLEDGQKIEVAAPRKLNIAVYVWYVDQLHLYISSLHHLGEPFIDHGVLGHLSVHEFDK